MPPPNAQIHHTATATVTLAMGNKKRWKNKGDFNTQSTVQIIAGQNTLQSHKGLLQIISRQPMLVISSSKHNVKHKNKNKQKSNKSTMSQIKKKNALSNFL